MIVGGFATAWERLRATPDPVALEYVVRVLDPAAQRLEVELLASGLGRGGLSLGYSTNSLSQRSALGRFRVRDARDAAGEPRAVRFEDFGWQVDGSGPTLRVIYEVQLGELASAGEFVEVASSSCDGGGARLQGADIFLFPLRRESSSLRVRYELPADWQLVHPFQVDEFEASYPDLRSLYHSVAAAGRLRTLRRVVDGCELVLAARGRFRFGDRDLMETIERIAEQQFEFFGGPPRDRYVFVMNEHRDTDDAQRLHYFGLHFEGSMSILLDPRTDRHRLQAEPAHIIAHEFFHNWIGEIVGQEGYEMNWFIEGATTYYAYQTARAINLLDNGSYARGLHERYDEHYLNNGARSRYSLAEAGTVVLQEADVTHFLYAAGSLAALALDAEIQRVSRQRVNLDDLMRELVLRARISGQKAWRLDRPELEAALLEMTGTDFGPWLTRYVYGREQLPLPEYVVQAAR